MKRKPAATAAYALSKWIMIPVGTAIGILGLVTFWLPLPVGLPLLLVSSLILIRHSVVARRVFAGANRRCPAFRRIFRRLRGLTRRTARR